MHPIKSVFAGLIVGLIARDLSLLSGALLTVLLAVVLYVWDVIRFVAEEGAWVGMKNAQEGFSPVAGRPGKMVLFLIGVDTMIIALVGASTYWVVGWRREASLVRETARGHRKYKTPPDPGCLPPDTSVSVPDRSERSSLGWAVSTSTPSFIKGFLANLSAKGG
jgi:hypothetical protein